MDISDKLLFSFLFLVLCGRLFYGEAFLIGFDVGVESGDVFCCRLDLNSDVAVEHLLLEEVGQRALLFVVDQVGRQDGNAPCPPSPAVSMTEMGS